MLATYAPQYAGRDGFAKRRYKATTYRCGLASGCACEPEGHQVAEVQRNAAWLGLCHHCLLTTTAVALGHEPVDPITVAEALRWGRNGFKAPKEFLAMSFSIFLVLLAGLLVVGLLLGGIKMGASRPRTTNGGDPITARDPLTAREQSMFFRLQTAFPEQIVLAQVAMSALLKAPTAQSRATFDRKVIDFVVCSKAFVPLLVIELDDASHARKAAKDAARDAVLGRAGYRVLRFVNIPDDRDLRASLKQASASEAEGAFSSGRCREAGGLSRSPPSPS
jgi:very-short-patch-repair endonuclease